MIFDQHEDTPVEVPDLPEMARVVNAPQSFAVVENPITEKEVKMDNAQNNGTNAGWGAGVGGLIGAAIGNGGAGGILGGNREPAVTPDQLGTALNGVTSRMDNDAVQAHLGRIQGQIAGTAADSTIALGAGIAGVKDAVVNSSAQNQLALCGIGHNMTAGFAAVNNTILLQGAQSRELALQQALDAERVRATELRIALSEERNQAGHKATQVLLSQVVKTGTAASA